MSTINPIKSYINNIVPFSGENDNDWNLAKDCVSYPVSIQPLFYTSGNNEDDSRIYELASGVTNTGRDTQFFGVVVDLFRDGNPSVISVVTDTYGTLDPAGVYDDLRDDLDDSGVAYALNSLYVSGNGGCQTLSVRILNVTNGVDDIDMLLSLQTSLDGTKRHTLRLSAWDNKNKRELLGVCGSEMNVATRHTKTIGERHAAFSVFIQKMIAEWESTIVPMMVLMNDMKFDFNDAIDIVKNLLEDSKIPERHVEKAVLAFNKNNGKMSMMDMMNGLSAYFDDALDGKVERFGMFQKNINRHVEGIFRKFSKK